MEFPPADEGGAADPRRSSYGREYWLRRCEGFVVETPTNRIGKVAWIRYGAHAEEPEALAVEPDVPGVRIGRASCRERV